MKLANDSQQNLLLDGYVLRTDSSSASRTSANTITLTGTLAPGEVVPVYLTDSGSKLSLTNSGGYVWIEDAWGFTHYEGTMRRYESAGTSLQGYAYALGADNEWAWTSTPQPTSNNTITLPEAAPCPDGKYRSPETNRCRTLEDALNALTACEEGYERNPTTNRCRKVASASASTLTPCKEGQERNPATNRCRSIASAVAELLPCDEGYERNPATNRCRKIRDTSVLGAKYPVQPYDQGTNATATWWVVGGIAALALGYAGWEWRREITAGLGRLRSVFTSGK